MAVGASDTTSTILLSTDGGSTWSIQTSVTNNPLNGVTCPSPSTCVAVGGILGRPGTILLSTDGGRTWSSRPTDTTQTYTLEQVACPSPSLCVAVGGFRELFTNEAAILRSTDEGNTWTSVLLAA
jgi:photosystem II stability/assembly factor-like uncharacterized protein